MVKTAQKSVSHASQTKRTIILSTTTTTTELFPQPSRHCCSDHCYNRRNNRKSDVLKHAVYIHRRNHAAVKTRSWDTMPVGVTFRLQDGRQTQMVARIPTRGRGFLCFRNCPMGSGDYLPDGEPWSWPPARNAEIKNTWNNASKTYAFTA